MGPVKSIKLSDGPMAALVSLADSAEVMPLYGMFEKEERRVPLFLAIAKHAAALAGQVAGAEGQELMALFRDSEPNKKVALEADLALIEAVGCGPLAGP